MKSNSLYSSPEAKLEILNLYQEKLDSLNTPYERQCINTQWGATNIVIMGASEKPPLVLLHGSNGNAAIILEPMLELLDQFQLIAIDVIGQPNYSAETRPSMKDKSYALWLDEVLQELQLKDVTIFGMSFGGFIINKALVHANSRIAKAILLVPAGVANGNPFWGVFRALIPMKRFIKSKDSKDLDEFLDSTFSEEDEFAKNYLEKVILHLKMDFTPVPVLTAKQASLIKTPCYLIAADADKFFPGERVINRYKKINPSLVKTLLLENCKHVPSKSHDKIIREFILGIHCKG